MTSPNITRTLWVDYAKGWCIVMVVMMHSTLGVGEALQDEGWLHFIVAWARPFRMPDFFLIAGLFLSRSINAPWRQFIDRKIIHFLYFYVIWMLIQLTSKQGFLLFQNPSAYWHEMGLAFLEPYTTLWFIYILPMMFVLTRLLKNAPKPLILALAMLAETVMRITGWHTDWIILDEFPMRYIYFYAGFAFAPLAFSYVNWVQKNGKMSLILLIIWCIIEAAFVFTPATILPYVPAHMLGAQPVEFGSLAFYPVLSLIFGFLGVGAVFMLAGLLATKDYFPPLRKVGAHSLVIYLSFFMPMAFTRIVLLRSGITSVTLISALVTLMGVIMPLLFYYATKKSWLKFLYKRPEFLHLRT